MSTILRALKKVEEESRLQQDSKNWERFRHARPPAGRRPGIIILTAGLVCGLLVAMGGGIIWQQDFISENSGSSAVATAPSAGSPPRQAFADSPAPTPPVKPDRPPAPASAGSIAPAPPPSRGEPVTLAAAPDRLAPPARPRLLIGAETAPPSSFAPAPQVEPPQISDPALKLQAVTWSRIPARRLAIISNRIVREGEAVAGYRVEVINQDDVELRQGDERWKLTY